jgi:hypothetical protein
MFGNDETDMLLLSSDPFFLLASLFTKSALSFSQLLNYLSVSVARYRGTEVWDEEEMECMVSQTLSVIAG